MAGELTRAKVANNRFQIHHIEIFGAIPIRRYANGTLSIGWLWLQEVEF